LRANHSYFNKLSPAEQSRFEERVIAFAERKTFSGRQDLSVTREVEISIAASAVQLTLGLETWDLSYFKQILVYPADYKSPATGKYHKGETNMGGFLCFSWKAFQEGNAIPNDKVNLGLHEFAHALRFNGIRGSETDYFFENYFARWLACAYSEFKKLQRDPSGSIFRKYGGVNINEFFSVAVETFFEAPAEFKTALPELYRHTSILLNQTFTDTGAVTVGCRNALLETNGFVLSKAHPNIMRFNLMNLGRSVVAVIFLLFGLIALTGGGHRYPTPYILLGIGAFIWSILELNYSRVSFGKDHFAIQKGFLIHQKWREKTMPYSALISFKASYEYAYDDQGNRSYKYVNRSSVAYYTNGNFYKEKLHIEPLQPAFDELCKELKRNNIFVAIME
jgi:Mlc titration factor MtfA (ptsG expression regulator)